MHDINQKIRRARELVRTVRHAAMATVNADGSPHNTPFFWAHSDDLTHLYWASNPDTQHSQNIARTGQIFVVLYDAFESGGLYIRADSAHATKGKELEAAHAAFQACAARADKEVATVEHYQATGPERLYAATVAQLWVNAFEKDAEGHITRDRRYEITKTDLLKAG